MLTHLSHNETFFKTCADERVSCEDLLHLGGNAHCYDETLKCPDAFGFLMFVVCWKISFCLLPTETRVAKPSHAQTRRFLKYILYFLKERRVLIVKMQPRTQQLVGCKMSTWTQPSAEDRLKASTPGRGVLRDWRPPVWRLHQQVKPSISVSLTLPSLHRWLSQPICSSLLQYVYLTLTPVGLWCRLLWCFWFGWISGIQIKLF